MHPSKPYRHGNRQTGLTLIEIMIALLLSTLLIGGVAQIFAGSNKTQRFQSGLSRVQENGRFAIEQLSHDMRQVGFKGCGGSDKKLTNMLDGNNADKFGIGTAGEMQGHRYSGGTWTPDDPGIGTVNDASVVQNNDVLAFTTLDPDENGPTVVDNHNLSNANLQFTDNPDVKQCDVMIVSTCEEMVVFVNNNNNEGSPATHSKGDNCKGSSPKPDVGNSENKITDDMSGGDLHTFKSYVYYVDQAADAEVPSLYRLDERGNRVELIQGIERLRYVYGEDTTGDGQVDVYRTDPGNVSDWTAVLGVRVELLAVSPHDNVTDEPQTYTFAGNQVTANDNRLYQVFTATVALRNRMR